MKGMSGLEASEKDPQDSRLPRLSLRLADGEETAGGEPEDVESPG